jgi:hypothetical protein
VSDIPRYRMTNSFGYQDNENGLWVRYEDHVAALKAARNELPDVGSWSPEPKFKVGDRVRNDMFIGTVTSIETYEDQEDEFWVAWDKGGQSQCDSRTLTLYVPPTPAELIPTLKEHEWVRGTRKHSGEFGPLSTYLAGPGHMYVGPLLLRWDSGQIVKDVTSIERCDPPEVK